MKQHSMSCPYPEGCTCGASEFNRLLKDIEELNHRLAKRVIDFNETDKKRLARIQELEQRLAYHEACPIL